MTLSEKEQRLWDGILTWEKEKFSYDPNDMTVLYQSWTEQMTDGLTSERLDRLNGKIDRIVFHFHALIQNTDWQARAREQLLLEAATFDPAIEDIEDLKRIPVHRLIFMAEKHMAKHRLLSSVHGGITGTGGMLFLTLDLPVSFAIQMHAIQMIALTYGEDVRLPGALMTTLNLFHLSLLPKKFQLGAWEKINKDYNMFSEDPYFFETDETTESAWLTGALKQVGKTLLLQQLKKKWIQGIPMIGIGAGAVFNYRSTKKATEIAHKFYQKQQLKRKMEDTFDESDTYPPQ